MEHKENWIIKNWREISRSEELLSEHAVLLTTKFYPCSSKPFIQCTWRVEWKLVSLVAGSATKYYYVVWTLVEVKGDADDKLMMKVKTCINNCEGEPHQFNEQKRMFKTYDYVALNFYWISSDLLNSGGDLSVTVGVELIQQEMKTTEKDGPSEILVMRWKDDYHDRKYADLAASVFGNHLILGEILSHVIRGPRKLDWKSVKNVRLVSHEFLASTSKLLLKYGEPAFVVSLNGREVEGFAVKYVSSNQLACSHLPIQVNLSPKDVMQLNSECMSSVVTNDLVAVQCIHQLNRKRMQVKIPVLSGLKRLTFRYQSATPYAGPLRLISQSNSNALWLLQQFLEASVKLQELRIQFAPDGNTERDQNIHWFESLRLPATITLLQLDLDLSVQDYKLFENNTLLNLRSLTLVVSAELLDSGTIFKSLEKLQDKLQNLSVTGNKSTFGIGEQPRLKLPRMEKLERLLISYMTYGWSGPSQLQECFPNLKSLALLNQSESMLLKWLENSEFENVNELNFGVVNHRREITNDNYSESPSLEIMNNINQLFLQLKILRFGVNIRNLDCLKYVFQNMHELEQLGITFNGWIQDDRCVDMIDAAFLGLPVRMVQVLKEDTNYFKSVVLKSERPTSITNLQALRNLSLKTASSTGGSFLSNLLFKLGFFKMTNLKYLIVQGRFKPTLKMKNNWEKDGRFMYTDE